MHVSTVHTSILAALLSSTVFIAACSPQESASEHPTEPSSLDAKDDTADLKEKTQAKSIQPFPKTADDTHDIELLNQYEQQFNQLSNDLETELEGLEKEHNLSEEMKNQRKYDLIQSSLNMLKALDLKTQQGRYIQGLYYQYWENQAKVYQELQQSQSNELSNPTDAIEGMSDYYTAQAQLQHWTKQNQS